MRKPIASSLTTKSKRSAINESCLPYFLGGITTYGFTSGTTAALKSKTGQSYVFPSAIDEAGVQQPHVRTATKS